ncbi:hypothetical protein [Roseicyclus mahoneyensis]|uniref:DUF732 domain-containing protein n=1 Tax=Roseicyclus mahoneyensis TaxID=164332 RepID=A0A316GCN3_9RHOB|nr:hypothetical protein [Roseicyclus mahoneyensis]PWK57975.1 hypothetical protein C7455_11124 [Roseicyclus mahoneyensis]
MNVSSTLPRVAFAAMILSGSALAVAADSYRYHHHGYTSHVITVSCYRGPLQDVIWDRPNPEFTDSLVNAGYTFPEAHAIAERVCRDANSVGRPGALSATMTDILRRTPPGS